MADTKISALASGAPALGTDNTVIQRDSNNFKLSLYDLLIYIMTPQNVKAIEGVAWVSCLLDYDLYTKTQAFTYTYNNGSSGVGATITNTGTFYALSSIDGVNVTTGMRVCLTNLPNAAHNGIYTITTIGSGSVAFVLTRATDFDSPWEMSNNGPSFTITSGLKYGGAVVKLLNLNPATVGTGGVYFTITPPLDFLADYVGGHITGQKFNQQFIPWKWTTVTGASGVTTLTNNAKYAVCVFVGMSIPIYGTLNVTINSSLFVGSSQGICVLECSGGPITYMTSVISAGSGVFSIRNLAGGTWNGNATLKFIPDDV